MPTEDNLTKRISYITIGSLLFLSVWFISTSYCLHLKFKEEDKINQLATVVNTLAVQINGDTYQQLIRKYPFKDQMDTTDPLYQQLHNQLKAAYTKNGLDSPIYLLTYDSENGEFYFGPTSSKVPSYRHSYSKFPEQLLRDYNVGGTMGHYQSEKGEWLSAFTPIVNSKGETVAVLQADSPFCSFRSAAFNGLIKNTIISCIVVFLFVYVIKKYMKRIVHLIKEKELAEQKAEIKSRFLSTMSHEIRTPMNAVIGLTNVMLDESPREDQKENLKTLKFSADFLLALINDVLDYSKLEADEIKFESIDFDLHQLLHNIGNSLKGQAEIKQLPLHIKIAPDVPRYIVNDSVRLSQVLTNLTGNAIKFTHEGEISIELKLIKRFDNKAIIRFAISDTGIGISKDKFDSIFQSFSQADAATTRKFGGTGLGLSITKRMLELQNSCVQLDSKLGKGSTFFFDLEVIVGRDREHSNDVVPVMNLEEVNFEGHRILLVEDNKINVMVALKFLKKWGFDVDVAENGQIALDKIQQNNYELVLMDLDMPVMDGYEATLAIRRSPDKTINQLPVIALSASAVSDFREKAIQVGMDEYVTKPFKPEELYSVLSRFIALEVQ